LPVPILRTVFVSRRRAHVDAARRAFEPELARWRRLLGEIDAGSSRPDAPVQDHALLGDPEEVMRQVERYRVELGMTHLVVRSPPGVGLPALEASLRELPELLRRDGA
jgi:alkanesulfonate monooxygenase SsuD/methylene tetrahydromethanopterin reductase-like flavin-dependent oxidoreductase (luciferase family)